ncbi:MAG: general secretion pathway protein GspK [Nitrospinae bacterium]|nr:general secretion pathway protein GspK [Nitrospinota bacterium]
MNSYHDARNRDRKTPGQEGAALLVTLLTVVILTVTITEFLYSTWVDRSFARRLLRNLDVDPDVADYVRDWITTNNEGPAKDAYYASLPNPYRCKNARLDSIEELRRVRGVTHEVFNKIRPFVTIRSPGTVNINTAPQEVLMALDGDITSSLADAVIRARNEMPFKTKNEIQNIPGFTSIFPRISNLIDVRTDTFSMSASITFNETTRKAEAILTERTSSSAKVVYFRVN